MKTSKYQKHKKQIQNSFNVPPPLLSKEDNCGSPVAKTYLDNSNGLHHSSNTYNKVSSSIKFLCKTIKVQKEKIIIVQLFLR